MVTRNMIWEGNLEEVEENYALFWVQTYIFFYTLYIIFYFSSEAG